MKSLLLALIRFYRRTGGGMRWFGVDCNFEPSCSAYTYTAIERFGAKQGVAMGWRRIRNCSRHDSFCKCLEPVPQRQDVNSGQC